MSSPSRLEKLVTQFEGNENIPCLKNAPFTEIATLVSPLGSNTEWKRMEVKAPHLSGIWCDASWEEWYTRLRVSRPEVYSVRVSPVSSVSHLTSLNLLVILSVKSGYSYLCSLTCKNDEVKHEEYLLNIKC